MVKGRKKERRKGRGKRELVVRGLLG